MLWGDRIMHHKKKQESVFLANVVTMFEAMWINTFDFDFDLLSEIGIFVYVIPENGAHGYLR